MALVLKDRVRETSTTTGTGTFTLAGAVAGFQSFSAIGTGNSTYYTIVSTSDWEVGIGTWTSPDQLSRDTVLASTNAGALVTFGSGTKDVFLTFPAEGFAVPPAIGGTTPNTITGTTITATNTITLPEKVNLGNDISGVIEMQDGGDGYDYLSLYGTDIYSNFYPVHFPQGLSITGGTFSSNVSIGSVGLISFGNGTTISGYISLYEPSNTNTVTIKANTSLTSPYNLILPATSGSNNQVLKTDGSGNLSWLDFGSPPAIGGTLPAAGTFTNIASATAPTNTVPALALTGTPNAAAGAKTGVLGVGPNFTASDKNIMASFVQNINDYTQIVVQNTNAGASASADFIVNNNNTAGAGTYGDFGINSSAFSGTGSFGLANATYLYSQGGDLSIGTAGANNIHFVINSGSTDTATITSTGVGIGVASPTAVLNLKAGTATASTAPLKFTNGVNLTVAEAGAVEYDGTSVFVTGTTASGRGVNFAPQMVRVNTDRAKTTNNTTLEAVFDAANDTLALAANTLYYFKGVYVITKSASATAAGVTIGFAFSNAQQDIGYKSIGFTVATGTAQTTIYNTVATAITATATATGATDYVIELEGWFKSNATTGGTLIPQFAQSVVGTTVAPTAKANTWFRIQPMSSTPTATLIAGNWS